MYDTIDLTKIISISGKIHGDFDSKFLKFKEISEIVKPDLFFCDAFQNDLCFDVAWLMKKPTVAIATSLLGKRKKKKIFFYVFFKEMKMKN